MRRHDLYPRAADHAWRLACGAWLILFAAGVVVGYVTAAGQDSDEAMVEIVPGEPPGTKILLVVDRSGSMTSERYSRALAAVRMFTTQPVDELQIACISFAGSDSADRWDGITERDVPPGWAALPSVHAESSLLTWLARRRPGGSTALAEALGIALREGAHGGELLSVLVVSDGERLGDPDELAQVVIDGRSWRTENDLGPVWVGCYGVGGYESQELAALGREGGGGYYMDYVAPPRPNVQGMRRWR